MGPLRTGSLESLRERNRLRVIDALRTRGAISRADIARQTGLSRSTVSSLVADLQAPGMVVERATDGVPATLAGPPAALLVARPLGRRRRRPRLRPRPRARRRRRPLHRSWPRPIAELEVDSPRWTRSTPPRELVSSCSTRPASSAAACSASAWACPARSTARPAASAPPPILPGWVGVDAGRRDRASASGSPVQRRQRRQPRRARRVDLGRRPRRRRHGLREGCRRASAPGSSSTAALRRRAAASRARSATCSSTRSGPICRCGNRGCLETFVGAPRPARARCADVHGDALTLHEVVALAREGDAGCQRAIADAGRVVGRAVATLCNLFNPDRSSSAATSAPPATLLLEPMREAVRRFAIRPRPRTSRSSPGALGERAEVLGALALVLAQSPSARDRLTAVSGTCPSNSQE